MYKRAAATWAQEAYIKASNNDAIDNFGGSVSLDGDIFAVELIMKIRIKRR